MIHTMIHMIHTYNVGSDQEGPKKIQCNRNSTFA
jgi:hypothetical protein